MICPFQTYGHNNATYNHPPEIPPFQHLFIPYTSKKPRLSKKTGSETGVNVHVHLHRSRSPRSEPSSQPFSERLGQRRLNVGSSSGSYSPPLSDNSPIKIDQEVEILAVPADGKASPMDVDINLMKSTDCDDIIYPSVHTILQSIDERGSFNDIVDFPLVVFATDLENAGLCTAFHVTNGPEREFYMSEIGMRASVAEVLIRDCRAAVSCAEKGKMKAN
jgi:hypothetical protein